MKNDVSVYHTVYRMMGVIGYVHDAMMQYNAKLCKKNLFFSYIKKSFSNMT